MLYIILFVVIIMIIVFSYTLLTKDEKNNNDISNNYGEIKTYTAYFKENGALKVSSKKITCNVYNDKCEITLPMIEVLRGEVLGWSTKNNSMSAMYKVGDVITIDHDQTFYAITYYENTLTIINNELDYLSNEKVSCRVYNDAKNCRVVVPNYNKIGYETRGYSTRSDSLTGIVFPNQSYTLNKDLTLYPIYNTLFHNLVIDTQKVINRYGFVIEIENSCSSSIYNEYLNYIDRIKEKASFLLIGSKITFLTDDTFTQIWTKNYSGMNYGPYALRLVDIRCSSRNLKQAYSVVVHELAHTLDLQYSIYHDGKTISEESDLINLYVKYKDMPNRPFTDYSYSVINEFFASAVTGYYFRYIEENDETLGDDYPYDLKEVIEKYICIAKNNYVEEGC